MIKQLKHDDTGHANFADISIINAILRISLIFYGFVLILIKHLYS